MRPGEEDLLHTPRPESRPHPMASGPRVQRTGLGIGVVNPTHPRFTPRVGQMWAVGSCRVRF